MNPSILMYIIKSIALSLLLLLLYILLHRHEKTFKFNRCFILISLLFIVFLPFVHFEPIQLFNETIYYEPAIKTEYFESVDNKVNLEIIDNDKPTKVKLANSFNVSILIYLVFSCILMFRFIINLCRIFNSSKSNKKIIYNGYTVMLLKNKISPFTFLGSIFINENDYNNVDIDLLFQHEIGHIKNYHSLDILLIEIIQIFLWFNPILIFIKRELKLIHEFQADEFVIQNQSSKKRYQSALINFVFRNNQMILASVKSSII